MYKKINEKRTVNLQMRKNDSSNRRKEIERDNKKAWMRIAFISEIYVYRQK